MERLKGNFRRYICLMIVMLFIVSGLAGCSNSSEPEKNVETATPTITVESPTEKATEELIEITATPTPEETPIPSPEPTEITGDAGLQMTDIQRNSISMLNYLAGLTQEINSSKNSRLYLESAYSILLNNTHPNAVDKDTQDHLIFLLDTLNNYRMIAVKREHLQFIFEQNRAQAMRDAVPNPLGLLSAVSSFDWKRIAASVVYMAVDSYTSYQSGMAQADMQFIQDGWKLDEEEQKVLHGINTETFKYLNETVRGNEIKQGELALNEEAVTTFVNWKNNSNVAQKIRFLESNQQRYKAYGDYWLVLAESYYSHGDYAKCLEAISAYESLDIRIFRDDKGYAKALPLAIISAGEVYGSEEYVTVADRYCEAILQNTNDNYDWALRYFAAQTYVDLFAKTENQEYLQKAYDIALDNANWLIGEQKAQNSAYLADVVKQAIPKDASDSEKKEIENYNKQMEADRKLALPPVYEPLLLNCELLFSLSEKLEINDNAKANVDEILHENGGHLFLIPTLDNEYSFASNKPVDSSAIDISFNGRELVIPAKYVASNSSITVTVTVPEENDVVTFTDWKLTKVERPQKDSLDSFKATFTSEEASKHPYKLDAAITIDIASIQNSKALIGFEYKTVNTKTDFFSSIAFWNSNIGFLRIK